MLVDCKGLSFRWIAFISTVKLWDTVYSCTLQKAWLPNYPSTSGEVTYVSFRSDDFRWSTLPKDIHPENDHMAITVGKSPHFSHIGMLHRFNPKPFFHCQPFLSFSSSCIYVGCFEEPPWLSDLKMCSVRFVIEVPVFSVKTHTSLAVSGNSYTYSTLFSTCRLDDIWMYQKQLWKLSKKNRQIYITQYSPVRACSWAIKL